MHFMLLAFWTILLSVIWYDVGYSGGSTAGKSQERNQIERGAVEAGRATYVCDSSTGTCVFSWKSCH